MKKIRIAIDGYAGCGKSSTARALADHLHYRYIDSGAMYRGITYLFIKKAIDVEVLDQVNETLEQITLDFDFINGECHLLANGEDIDNQLRTMSVNKAVSQVSALPQVRQKLVAEQQRYGRNGGIVMDGRDIGTVVFPDAELKLFLVADVEVRAARRQKELKELGTNVELQQLVDNFRERDEIDSTRAVSPLRKAKDAIEIDTSNLTFDQQINQIIEIAEGIIHGS